MRRRSHDYLRRPAHKNVVSLPAFHNRTHGALGRCETHSWPSSLKRALEAAPQSRSSSTWSIGTTGLKTTAELLEQEDAMASAAGTTRAPPAVRRPIAESSYVLRAGLPQARRRPPSAINRGVGFECTHTMSRMDCAEGIYQRPERSPQQSITPCRQAASVGNAPHISV
jgi:hypothetical protein